jgi:hypothetical protein
MAVWQKQDVTCTIKYIGDTITDEMLLDYAKHLWDNNLIKTELICEDGVKKIKFKSTCVRILKPEDNDFVDDNAKEKSEDDNTSTKKLPWYKRIFEN